ncbi:MAG TPA: hypothetical protein VNT33_03955 [Telluria sp.]|nr:hypothetical protein [Telluria sp.]
MVPYPRRFFRTFLGSTRPEPESDAYAQLADDVTIRGGYEDILAQQLAGAGIAGDTVKCQIRRLGRASDGRFVYTMDVRLVTWERPSAFRLLLGLPMLEERIQHAVHGSPLADVSHFRGLWVHISSQLRSSPAAAELAAALAQFERGAEAGA